MPRARLEPRFLPYEPDGGAAGLTGGFRVRYNRVRSHKARGETPAEAAGLEPSTGFKWLEVIKAAASAGK